MNAQNDCNMHEALMAYLYDEATPEERLRVDTHLAECAACGREIQAFERVRGMLQQWQLDDVPVLRVVAESQSRRSLVAAFRELSSLTPIWAKALGAMAMAMLVLAVLGTDISIGRQGVSLHADLLRRNPAADSSAAGLSNVSSLDRNNEQIRSEIRALVNELIADSERQQKEDLTSQLVSLQSQLENLHSADLAKIAMRIQEQRVRLNTIERDIDRREGLDLTDILFSEVSRPASQSGSGGGD